MVIYFVVCLSICIYTYAKNKNKTKQKTLFLQVLLLYISNDTIEQWKMLSSKTLTSI